MAGDRGRQQAWRTTSASKAGGEPGPRSRGSLGRLLVFAVVLAIVGVIAGVLVFLRPTAKPIFLGIPVTQYENRAYRPNPWAQHDSDALRQHFESDSPSASFAQQKQSLLDAVTQLADRTAQGKDKGRPLVVFISAHAMLHDGKVQVLPGRADPDNPASRLPLGDVLTALRRGAGPRLLLLDLAHPMADAHAGILANDVADHVHAELSNAELPFHVLASCDRGQTAHVSTRLGRSVFGWFVEQGLLGHADGWLAGNNKNGQVSVLELIEFVKAQVGAWSMHEKLTPQTPQSFGNAKDFLLISPRKQNPLMALPESVGEYPKFLAEGWKERDGWRRDGTFRLTPRGFRELEVHLERAEQRWFAGDDEARIKTEFEARLADLRKLRSDSMLKPALPRSLAAARRVGLKDEKVIAAAVRPLLERIQAKTPLKPDDLKPLAEKPPEAAPFAAIAHQVWSAMLELPDPSPEQLKEFDAFLKAFTPAPRFIEMAALRFLLDLDAKTQERWAEASLRGVRRLVLHSAEMAERAAAMDPRALPWVRGDLEAADKLRRDGLLQLATGGIDARIEGRDKLQQANTRYEAIEKTAQGIEHAILRLEDCRAFVTSSVWALGQRSPEPAEEQLLLGLFSTAGKIQKLLASPGGAAPVGEFVSLADRLQSDLELARRSYHPAALDRILRRVEQPNGPGANEFQRLLDSPLWAAVDRSRIIAALLDIEGKSAAGALAQAAGLKPGSAGRPAAERAPDDPVWRARLALELLRLDGITPMAALDEALAVSRRSEKPDRWVDLAWKIRQAWAVALPARFRESAETAERLGAIVHPVDATATPEPDQRFVGEPTPAIRRRQIVDLQQWLARQRYRADAATFSAVANRHDLAAYAKALDDLGLELQTRVP